MSEDRVLILGISGSLRRESYNTGLLHAAAESPPPGVRVEIADISGIPLYKEELNAELQPQAVVAFKEMIRNADALLFAVPEYNYSIPGVLKNAIDWASRPVKTSPLSGKPAAMMGVGGSYGTVRAQMHLRQIAVATNMLLLNKPELMVQMPTGKFAPDGRLVDPQVRERVVALVTALRDWSLRLKGVLRD
jgi:chromate reductase